MRRILAQTRKELTQILRDRLALILALVLPLILLCLLGSSISLTARDVPVVVRDLDDSLASHTFLDQLRQSISFHVVAWDITRQPEEVLIAGAARAHFCWPVLRPYFSIGTKVSRRSAYPIGIRSSETRVFLVPNASDPAQGETFG